MSFLSKIQANKYQPTNPLLAEIGDTYDEVSQGIYEFKKKIDKQIKTLETDKTTLKTMATQLSEVSKLLDQTLSKYQDFRTKLPQNTLKKVDK